MKKRWLILLTAVVMVVTSLTTTVYADESAVLEGSVQVDLIDWVTQTGGMSLAERAQINMFVEEQTVADYEGAKAALVEGILNWETNIDVSEYQIPVEDAWALYSEVCYENPQLFYIETGCSYSYWDYLVSISPRYNSNFTEEDVLIYEAKVEEILDCVPNGMNEEDTAVALHDYLVSHCAYDTTYSNYDAYSALVEGSCVCQGYALAYSDLLNRCSIENEYVVSDSMNHAWNLVNVDDEWYHVDATWDDPLMGGADFLGHVGHNNFLRSDVGITDTGHYSWVASNDCDATKYDNYYWSGLKSAIVFSDATTSYYMKDGVLCQRIGTDVEAISYSADDIWSVWGSSGYWGGCSFNSLVLNQNNLYYNSSEEVYVYDLITGEESLYYTYTGGEGYVYGLAEALDEETLLLNIKTSPNEKTVDVVSVETINNKIRLNQTSALLTSKGETLQLIAIEDASNVICEAVVWKSSDTSVVTVDNNGIVTAVGNGTATITATTTDGTGRKATCQITVEHRYQDGLNLYDDGNLYYFKDNKIDTSYNGVADYENETWYVANGKVDTSVNGLANAGGTWYLFKDGKVNHITTVEAYAGSLWYVENGEIDFNKNGLHQVGNWYYFKNGAVDNKFTGLINSPVGWLYIEKGQFNSSYDGVADYAGSIWYIKNGQIDFSKNGLQKCGDAWYYFKNGAVDSKFTGLTNSPYGWWYIEEGKLEFDYTNLVHHGDSWWYVQDSNITFKYDGVADYAGSTWYIEDSRLVLGKNGLLKWGDSWYYFKNSAVDTNVKGLINSPEGWIYMEEGRFDATYDGVTDYDGFTWYIEDGRLVPGKNGLQKCGNEWYYFKNSTVDYNFTGLTNSPYGWWYIENGKLEFDYTNLVHYGDSWWYVEDSNITFQYDGVVDYAGSTWYVEDSRLIQGKNGLQKCGSEWYYFKNSIVDNKYTGLTNSPYGWWYIENGKLEFDYTNLVYHGDSWWYVQNSNITFNYDGIVSYDGAMWYIQDSRIDTSFSGMYEFEGKIYKVVNGQATLTK